jgi:predicted ArsR family transcriptional regulator
VSSGLYALIGVGVGAILSGAWAVFLHNAGLAEAQRASLLARLDKLLDRIAVVETAAQRFVGAANLFFQRADADRERLLEDAGKAGGDMAVGRFAAEVLAEEIGGDALRQSVKVYGERAGALLRTPMPNDGSTSPAEVAFTNARDNLQRVLGAEMARVRTAKVPLRSKLVGRFP